MILVDHGKIISTLFLTDSKLIFDTITKLTGESEKRLMIDIATLRQSHSSGEITNIGDVLTENDLADPLTKRIESNVLEKLMKLIYC